MVPANDRLREACRTDARRILAFFEGWEFDPDSTTYLRFHARRYAFLLKLLRECVGKMPGGKCERLLDIGPNFLTEFLRGGGGRLPKSSTVSASGMAVSACVTATHTTSST